MQERGGAEAMHKGFYRARVFWVLCAVGLIGEDVNKAHVFRSIIRHHARTAVPDT